MLCPKHPEAKLIVKYGATGDLAAEISTVITNIVCWYDDAGFLSKSAPHSLPAGYK
jgi:hypothetical protein